MTQKPESPESGRDTEARGDRKERVLHTRVPAVLEQELKRFAENLRVPVSNLVRTILEDALDVADAAGDRVEERLRTAATQLEKERAKLKERVQKADPLAGVFAFQEVTLAQPATCARCGEALAPGARAFLGLSDRANAPRRFVCGACLPHASAPESAT